jgi:hypothetical protein
MTSAASLKRFLASLTGRSIKGTPLPLLPDRAHETQRTDSCYKSDGGLTLRERKFRAVLSSVRAGAPCATAALYFRAVQFTPMRRTSC